MSAIPYGRIVFAASAILFGVIALMWHDAETWQGMHGLWKVPLGYELGLVLMAAQIAGGLVLLYAQRWRAGSVVLAVVYGIFALTCAAAIVASPATFGLYDGFFEQLSLLSGALAFYAPRAARIGLGLSAVSFTATQAVYLRETAALVPAWLPPGQMFWSVATTIAFALAAAAILIGWRAVLAMRLMALMTGLFGILVWIPILIAHPASHFSWSEFALTALITGATLCVADALASDSEPAETAAAPRRTYQPLR